MMTVPSDSINHSMHSSSTAIVIAWIVTLFVSSLGDIVWFELTGEVPFFLFWAKFILLGILILISKYWILIRALRPFFLILFVITVLLKASSWLLRSPYWINWQNKKSFSVVAMTAQWVELAVALLLIGMLFLILKKRQKFFLVMGDFKARIVAVKWLGQKSPEPLWRFGLIFTVVVIVVQIFMFILPLSITYDTFVNLMPLIPVILILAAFNGFTEEIIFRAAPIATLHQVVGKSHAIWMVAVMFGLAHYIGGIPSGITGVLTTSFLGWFFGKCLIESKGLFWPWLFHFIQDILPYTLMSLASIK
jgi:hypothetical protein